MLPSLMLCSTRFTLQPSPKEEQRSSRCNSAIWHLPRCLMSAQDPQSYSNLLCAIYAPNLAAYASSVVLVVTCTTCMISVNATFLSLIACKELLI